MPPKQHECDPRIGKCGGEWKALRVLIGLAEALRLGPALKERDPRRLDRINQKRTLSECFYRTKALRA